jgi:glycosyltransferase involved in cell wall biosynthesis
LGFVSNEERDRLLRAADIFCFPSYYPHEGQPAVLLEALALDLPIVATRWRGIPENLPTEHVYGVEPQAPAQIAAQLRAARAAGPPGGALRRHYLAHFTRERHHAAVESALREICVWLSTGSRP